MILRVHWLVIATCLIASARLTGQTLPDYGFVVVPVAAEFHGDTLRIGYQLVNPKGSVESIGLFNVPYAVPAVQALAPDSNWMVISGGRRIKSVEWGTLDTTVMMPGATSPDLVYGAVGVVGVVTAWLSPYRSTPTEEDVMAAEAARRRLDPAPMFVTTIGVVPVPSTSTDLIALLQANNSNACTMAWISNAGICNSLSHKLAAASASLTRGDTAAARNQLGAFQHELDAQRGKHVSDNAYWLLKTNTDYVLMHL